MSELKLDLTSIDWKIQLSITPQTQEELEEQTRKPKVSDGIIGVSSVKNIPRKVIVGKILIFLSLLFQNS
ncbi:MAG: hypothetical protein ACK5MZ_07700, partial [Aestuariibaculum sp.]